MAKKNNDANENDVNTKKTEQRKSVLNDNDKNISKKIAKPKKSKEEIKLEKNKELNKLNRRKEKYQELISKEIALKIFQRDKKKKVIRKIIINASILLLSLGIIAYLSLNIKIFFAGLAIPILVITGFNIFKAIRLIPKLKNPYEMRKMILENEAQKEHLKRNKKIQENYKAEKKRIKMMKKLPYKALGTIAFLLTMFTLIACYFVFDVQLTTTILLLLAVFTVSYFIVGILMTGVFYLVSENKTREYMIQLEEEKRQIMEKERLRSEELLRKKLAAEQKKYEEEELIRIEEEKRHAMESELLKIRREEEKRAFELSVQERQKILEETRFSKKPILLGQSVEDLEKQKLQIENKLLDDLNSEFENINLGGIEDFVSPNQLLENFKQTKEPTLVNESVEQEMDNSLLTLPKGAIINHEKLQAKGIPIPVMPDIAPQTKERNVNPQSVSIIKEMLKG